LVKMLSDKVPARRAAAAQALCAGPLGDNLPAVRKLLKDRDPSVRLKVALGLAGAREPVAVPVLIKLVGELPAEQSTQAEEYLTRLAKARLPKGLVEGDDNRKKRSDVWAAWWKDNRDRVVMVDRFAPVTREPYHGYTILVQSSINKIVE